MSTTVVRRTAPPNGTEAMDSVSLLQALVALEKGDFTVRLPANWIGVPGKVADAFNRVAELNQSLAEALTSGRARAGRTGPVTFGLIESIGWKETPPSVDRATGTSGLG